MNLLFVSDLHLGQPSLLKYRTRFASVEEHDNTILENILPRLNKNTMLYILGDAVIGEAGFRVIRAFRATGAKVVLLLGNHCTESMHIMRLISEFDAIHGSVDLHGIWLTHQPIHADHLRGRVCVHGHEHEGLVNDPRYVNVCLEHTGFQAITLEEIRAIFLQRIESGLLDRSLVHKLRKL